ncbi:prepilin-type N-terminal cleavage/methylation domain-containing protein [bacterium]|nr:prepilin-type N-terminal cleavage/methylation domain-containing protein [bacterium]
MSNNNRGFTLVEITVVAALLMIMATILFGTLGGLVRSRNAIETTRFASLSGGNILTRINRELLSRVAENLRRTKNTNETRISNASAGATGEFNAFSQTNPAQATSGYLRGVDEKNGENDADSITFVTDSSLLAGQGFSSRVEVTYKVRKEVGKFGSEKNKHLILERFEYPVAVKNKKITNELSAREIISDTIKSFNVRYYRNENWLDSWNEKNFGFPEAVEITIELYDEINSPHSYSTIVPLVQKTRSNSNFAPLEGRSSSTKADDT